MMRERTRESIQILGELENMEKKIVKDVLFLSQKSSPAAQEDLSIGIDLLDTLRANRARCVGLAANMIGIKKRIIVIADGLKHEVLFNPVLVQKAGSYETEEGCLSLEGVRTAKRWQEITVEYYDMNWKKQRRKYSGFTAQIIQHEMDHLDGILI